MSESTIHKTDPATIDATSTGAGAPIEPRSPLPQNADLPPVDASTIPATIPKRTEFGRYRILDVLGEGGIGVVYRAWDMQLCREVALKLLRRDSPQQKVRLLREARAQARLDHANICRIYEAGEFEGEPYIAMQCIDGVPLSQLAARLNLQQKVEIGRQIAGALHAAHREGLIHRDVKPANILVEQREDQSLRAYMTDFGLVRDLAEEQGTQTGVILGTWEYMAPEQVRGDVRAIDRRTDVYGLGALLYELFTGHTPYGQQDPGALSLAMARGELPPPIRWKRDLPADLEAVLLKCLETRMEDRYSSAWAVAKDLQKYLDGQPVTACHLTPIRRAWRRMKRYRWAALAVLALLLLLGGLAAERAFERARQNRMGMAAERYVGILGRIEMLLLYAYLQPAHDVGEDLAAARRLLGRIESSMREEGEEAEGPGNYVLGRGELLVGDAEAALRRLRSAWTAGYQRPEVAYHLVRALMSERQLRQVQVRLEADDQVRKTRLAELDRRYDAEIRLYMEAAQSAEGEIPIEMLRAVQTREYGRALELLQRSREQLRWPLEEEAMRIRLETRQAELDQEQGRYEQARSGYERVRQYLQEHGETAASYPEKKEAACALFLSRLNLATLLGREIEASYRDSLESVRDYLRMMPDNAKALRLDRQVRLLYAQWQYARGYYAREELEEVIAQAQRAIARNSRDVEALRDLASAWRILAFSIWYYDHSALPDWRNLAVESIQKVCETTERIKALQPLQAVDWHNLGAAKRGWVEMKPYDSPSDPLSRSRFREAETDLEAALRVDERYAPAHKDLGYIYYRAACMEMQAGRSPSEWLEKSLMQSRRAIELVPGYYDAWDNLAMVLGVRGRIKASRGEDPTADFQASEVAWQENVRRNPTRNYAYLNAWSYGYAPRARFEFGRGGDFLGPMRRGKAMVSGIVATEQGGLFREAVPSMLLEYRLALAYYRILSGSDPQEEFRQSRPLLKEIGTVYYFENFHRLYRFLEAYGKMQSEGKITAGQMEEIRWITRLPFDTLRGIQEMVLDPLTGFLDFTEYLIKSGISPLTDLSWVEGHVEKLRGNYLFEADAIFHRGRMNLIRAEWLRRTNAVHAGKGWRESAQQAKSDLEEAIRINRWLEKRVTPHLRRAGQLLSGGSDPRKSPKSAPICVTREMPPKPLIS